MILDELLRLTDDKQEFQIYYDRNKILSSVMTKDALVECTNINYEVLQQIILTGTNILFIRVDEEPCYKKVDILYDLNKDIFEYKGYYISIHYEKNLFIVSQWNPKKEVYRTNYFRGAINYIERAIKPEF